MTIRHALAWGWKLVVAGALLPALVACKFGTPEEILPREVQAQREAGRDLTFATGCVSCHEVPGLSGHPGNIAPPLTDWSRRKYIAGRLPNETEALVRWIMNPQEVDPGTAMPDLGVTEAEARDIAAYLYSL